MGGWSRMLHPRALQRRRLYGRLLQPGLAVQPALTLVELLMGMAAGLIVAGGMAAVMVSEVRQLRRNEQIASLRSGWQLAMNLIEAEAQLADRVVAAPASPACSLGSSSVKLALTGHQASWTTVYAVRAVAPAEQRTWQGPHVLVRCGPPFAVSADGALSVDAGAAVAEGVVAEGLPASASFAASLAGNTTTQVSRDLEATLTLAIDSATYSNQFRVRMASNPLYGLNTAVNLGLLTCSSSSSTCRTSTLPDGSSVREWRVTATTTIQGNSTDEDIVYFNAARSAASLSSTCNRAACTVTIGAISALLTNADVLVFTDEELRL